MFTTHRSHYKTGYDNVNNLQFREHKDQCYTVEFGRAETITNFKQESINAAKQIYKDANGKTIYISYSGGVDSEFIIHAFLEAKVPFEVITARFKHNINGYDFNHVARFASKYSFKLNILDVDIENFLETKMMEYAVATKCCSPQFPLHMYLWDSFDGFIVAGHELIFRRTPPSKEFYFKTLEKEDSVHRYHIWRNRNGAPAFYFYTPELVLTFILESELLKLFTFGKVFQKSYSGNQKTKLYEKCFKMEKREPSTGFETIMNIDKKYRIILEKMFKFPPNHACMIPIDILIKQLCPAHFIQDKIIP